MNASPRGKRTPRPPRPPRQDWPQALPYEDPEHLRASIEHLPAAPGVYVFHGQEGDLPVYIGKSINIRARVLSHLRTVEEAALLRQTRRISHIRTAGEIGALLLESQMIKRDFPLFNQKLRRSRQWCTLRIEAGVPQVVRVGDIDFSQDSGTKASDRPAHYGLFNTPKAAIAHLHGLADEHRLCHGLLGLEKTATGRPCFRHQLRACLGACCGKESAQAHGQRLQSALQAWPLLMWPFQGAVALIERDPEDASRVDHHVFRHWCHLGTAASLEEARAMGRETGAFDGDVYKIAWRPLTADGASIEPLG